jgi:hypothetical protein
MMNDGILERIREFEDKTITSHPFIESNKKTKKHGECKKCGLYSSLFSYDKIDYFCQECFIEVYEIAWKRKKEQEYLVAQKERLENAWRVECNKRHTKGHSPINLRR